MSNPTRPINVDTRNIVPKHDKDGNLIALPMSKGPKVGSNGEYLPSRYEITGKAPGPTSPSGTPAGPEHVLKMVRQDN